MEKKKSPGAISLGGFILGIAGIIVSMVGIGKMGAVDDLGNVSKILSVPTGLFFLYLGFGIAALGTILWTVGVVSGWDDVPEDKGAAGMRIFGAIPFILGIVTLLGGVRDNTGKMIMMGTTKLCESNVFLMIVGAVIAVVGLLVWFIGFKKSKVKTTILLRGSSKRAKFFRDYRSELKKISWQSWRDTYRQSGVVLVTLVVFAVIVGVLDILFFKTLNEWILELVQK